MVAFNGEVLIRIRRNDPYLLTLGFIYHGVTGDQAEQLANALEKNTKVKWLTLVGNVIGDAGLEALAKSLERNTAIDSLHLGDCGITDAGVQDIAHTLLCNRTLRKVSLRHNGITNSGALYLSRALLRNQTLSYLNLYCNNIKDEGVMLLACAIQLNSGLNTLGFMGLMISAEGGRALSNAVKNIEDADEAEAARFAEELFHEKCILRLNLKETATVFHLANDTTEFKERHLKIYYDIDGVERVLEASQRSGQRRLARAVYTKGMKVLVRESDSVEDDVMHLLLERLGSVTGLTGVFQVIKTRPYVINLA